MAPGARSVFHSQHIGTGSEEVRLVDQSLTSKNTTSVDGTGLSAHSDSEDDLHSEPYSPAGTSEEQGVLSDRDTPGDGDLDQEFSEELTTGKP